MRADALTGKLPTVAAHLDAARADVLAFTAFPKEVWRQSRPADPPHRPRRRKSLVVAPPLLWPRRPATVRTSVPAAISSVAE